MTGMIWDELQRLRSALAELDQEQTGVTRALEAFRALEDAIAEAWPPAPRVDLIAEPLPEPRQPAYQKVFYQDALYYVKQEELRKARAYEADLAMLKQRGQKLAQAYEREYALRLFAPLGAENGRTSPEAIAALFRDAKEIQRDVGMPTQIVDAAIRRYAPLGAAIVQGTEGKDDPASQSSEPAFR